MGVHKLLFRSDGVLKAMKEGSRGLFGSDEMRWCSQWHSKKQGKGSGRHWAKVSRTKKGKRGGSWATDAQPTGGLKHGGKFW